MKLFKGTWLDKATVVFCFLVATGVFTTLLMIPASILFDFEIVQTLLVGILCASIGLVVLIIDDIKDSK